MLVGCLHLWSWRLPPGLATSGPVKKIKIHSLSCISWSHTTPIWSAGNDCDLCGNNDVTIMMILRSINMYIFSLLQVVDNLHLCVIEQDLGRDGFYTTVASVWIWNRTNRQLVFRSGLKMRSFALSLSMENWTKLCNSSWLTLLTGMTLRLQSINKPLKSI